LTLLRFVLRVVPLVVWGLLGLLCVALCYPLMPALRRDAVTRRWSRVLLFLCGVKIRVEGKPADSAAALWVANHVSWVDIFVMNSVRGTSFISKDDVRGWPVVGWLVAGAGTVFISRGQRQVIPDVARQMRERFDCGRAVGLFPEGAASPGLDVGPFHASLFEAAIKADVAVQPIALRYIHRGRRTAYLSYEGDQTLLQNMWLLLGTTGAVVEIVFLPAIPSARCRELGRGGVAKQARSAIRSVVVAP
jgi:1-acyl-sn-glycerol-3-phosphate acyltransferase